MIFLRLPHLNRLNLWLKNVGRPVIFTSLLLTAAVVGARQLGLLQGMELFAYDHLIRVQPQEAEDDRLLIVGISDSDLQLLKEWPISDRTLAQLLAQLETYQPRVIGLDVTRDIPIPPGRDELLQQLQTQDNIITVCKASSSEDPGTPPPPEVSPTAVGLSDLLIDSGGVLRRSLIYMEPPPPPAGTQISHFCNQPVDADNNPNTIPTLSLRLVMNYLSDEGIELGFGETGEIVLGTAPIKRLLSGMAGYYKIDTNGYQILLRYRAADPLARQVSLMDVLQGRVPPEWIQDRIVLIGYTTPQFKDEFYTPYSGSQTDHQKMPGVFIHAQAVSQLLSAVLDGRSLIWSWSELLEIGWIWSWSLVGGILAWYLRRPLRFVLVLGVSVVTVYGVSWLLFTQGGWIPLVPAAIALMGTAGGVVLLDRFNKSDYGQTVYRQVKTLLKIDIEIDQEKRQKQVAEITETDYFQDLRKTAKSMRNRRTRPLADTSTATGSSASHGADSSDSNLTDSDLKARREEDDLLKNNDYLAELQQAAKGLKNRRIKPIDELDKSNLSNLVHPESSAEPDGRSSQQPKNASEDEDD
jgi:CHASE2 domain-containing sensor protein